MNPNKADNNIRLRSLDNMTSLLYKDRIPYKWLIILLIFAIFKNSYACEEYISKYESQYQIPQGLLKSIAEIESELNSYALNHNGKGYHFESKEQITTKIHTLIKSNKTNFDVGCMQLNYYWHGKNFPSINKMIEPEENVKYAASYLTTLYKKSGNWHQAVRLYHSKNPNFYKKYSRKIALMWIKEE